MLYIAAVGVLAILLLQATGSIPMSSVGGPMTIAAVILTVVLAVGIHEAWTMRRGVFGWIINLVVAFFGGLVGAQLGGFVASMTLPYTGSLAATGGAVFAAALVIGMLAAVAGAWGALQAVNRFRATPAR